MNDKMDSPPHPPACDPAEDVPPQRELILVVDDDPGMRRMLRRLLEPLGHEVLVAEGGMQALDLASRTPVDLVLSDLKMPELDGLALLQNLRERGNDAAFILLTAFGDLESIVDARDRYGLSNFFVKPIFSQDKFLFDIMTALAKRRLELENRVLLQALAKANQGLEEKVTERTRELSEKNSELERVSSFRAEVIKVLSHELRTPVAILKGYMGLETGGCESDASQAIRVMRHAVDRVQMIVDQATQLKRGAEPAPFTVSLSEVDPNSLCAEAVASLRPLVASRGIEIAFIPEAPSVCRWDARRIETVIEEVLINAVRASRDGQRVTVQVRSLDERVRVSVRDDGVGIPESERQRIFEPFVTLGPADRHHSGQFAFQAQGAGLGLAVAKLWMDLHHGELEVRANDGAPGTTVVLSLPRQPHGLPCTGRAAS